MLLNKTSWHANLYDFFYSEILPKNFCTYFWKLVWAIFITILFMITCVICVYSSIAIFWTKNEIIYTFGVIAWGFYILIIILIVTYLMNNWWINRKAKGNNKKSSNLLLQYIKAKKEEYCPIIEWKSN